MTNCSICNIEFIPKSHNGKYCTSICNKIHKNNLTKAYIAKLKEINKTYIDCIICKTPFIFNKKLKTCSKVCSKENLKLIKPKHYAEKIIPKLKNHDKKYNKVDQTKICCDCNIWKSLSEFHLHQYRCKKCAVIFKKEYTLKNADKIKENNHIYYSKNQELILSKGRNYTKKNKEKIRERARLYWQNNRDFLNEKSRQNYINNIEKRKISSLKYKLNNKFRRTYDKAIRRSAQLQRTPIWLTKFDYDYIKHIYIQAKELEKLDGIKRHVDHIIPLQGKTVSGFHMPQNLQILTAKENTTKGNKLYDN